MTISSHSLVDEPTITAFNRDGAVLLKSIIADPVLTRLRASSDAAMSQSDNYFRRQRVWEYDDACREYCLDSKASQLASEFLNSVKVNLLYDQVFAKQPHALATPWHNDQPYWPVRGGPVLTVWLALDPIKFNSGPLEFIAGSHNWNRWFQPFVTKNDGSPDSFYEETDENFEPLPDFESERDQHEILCWEMDAGDLLVFHALVVHGARENSSTNMRRGYAVRYTGDGVTYHTGAEVNPRIINPSLKDGQLLDSEQYPVAYARD